MTRDSDKIRALLQDLARLRRRAARQKRNIENTPAAWQRWSTTMDEIASLTQRLVASPAPDTASLVAKFRAIMWLIEVNESLLDSGDLHRLRRFGRELIRLTTNSPAPRTPLVSLDAQCSNNLLDCPDCASMCCGHRPAAPGPCR